jgi:D-alanine--poly(phosphoribitol) ligase subunit 1
MAMEHYICNLGRAFADTAMRNLAAPALRLADGDVSYGELEALASRLARWLISRAAGRDTLVALQNSKTLAGYAAMLACLRIGAAYTNLDVQNPPDRLLRILSICRPIFVLCDTPPAQSLTDAAAQAGVPVISLGDHTADFDATEATAFARLPAVTADDPAYIMFTSGSTGIPKGVAISHGSVLNFIAWVRSAFGIGPGDVVANVNPIYFDNSVFDFYGALFLGACLAPIGNGNPDAAAMVRGVDDARCTIWFSVPSLLIYLMTLKALRADTFRSVRSIVFGGEGYPKSELSKLFDLYSGRSSLYNVYGPTECTCICSVYRISAEDLRDSTGLPPLGEIADNFSYLVLDGDATVTSGDIGELCLMGPQLALGYYNDPERTAVAFSHNPLARTLPQRMYRTGDLVRDLNGILHFVGRRDNQIKHMGYRIELEEIEDAINRLGYVVQAAVTYRRVRDSFGHIVAHIAANDEAVTEARLRDDLKAFLPSYMVPSRFVIASELPKSANGKVDRARLRDL